ncbi:hypothetical protein NQ318_006479 [Aromia moschata]|uniref:DUF4817 domain-containing protein n=1 Tax=Aromia moschata TaxID=1265417 RepID=A0AAV8XDB0_9CUCU|nr:hypothetical protein NQ318_006479 [Aromia moschata]
MSYLTESLKIEILMMIGYGDRARTQCEVVRLFRETHPDLPPLNHGTISKIEAQYREMGHAVAVRDDYTPLTERIYSEKIVSKVCEKIFKNTGALPGFSVTLCGGHVRKVPSKRQAVVDDDTKLNLLLAREENPITPVRQLARDSSLNHKTVLKNT